MRAFPNQKIGRLAHPIYLPPISRVIKSMSLLISSFIQRPFNYLVNGNDCQSEITVIIPICYHTELDVWFPTNLAVRLSYLCDLIMLLWVSFYVCFYYVRNLNEKLLEADNLCLFSDMLI